MPDEFKKNPIRTDAGTMRDSTTNETPVDAFLIDGDVPRLAAPVLPKPTPVSTASPLLVTPDALLAPPPPGSAPLLIADSPSLPMPMLAAPVLSGAGSSSGASDDGDGDGTSEPRHPLAHLMPEKSKPTEASIRAAQLRAAKKAKARRTKIIVIVVMLAIAAVVGPPAFRWLADAVNEAGSTKTDEEPTATTVPVTSTPATDAPSSLPAGSTPASVPAEGATGGLGGLAGLPGDAQDAVDATNADVTDIADTGATTVAP